MSSKGRRSYFFGCGIMQRVSGIPQGTCSPGYASGKPRGSLLCLTAGDLEPDLLVGIDTAISLNL